MTEEINKIKLTAYSKGAGCGCKIAPNVLQTILGDKPKYIDEKLLVGNGNNDDAAVYDRGDGMATISTTDFFMPIVDDAYDFGQIAAANALSDVYAMGGKPLMALAILGWPIQTIDPSVAAKVLQGARDKCAEAGIPLAGGHSIESTEPIFGLSVTGEVATDNIKTNGKAKEGDLLFLTKPIGTGVWSTAMKRGLLSKEHEEIFVKQIKALNTVGYLLGKEVAVTAITDVTGFGLLGHLIEMTEAAGLGAELYYNKVLIGTAVQDYITQKAVPDATFRNWNSYNKQVDFAKDVAVMEAFNILPDPQTNGGLLFTVSASEKDAIVKLLTENGLQDFVEPIGKITKAGEKRIIVMNK